MIDDGRQILGNRDFRELRRGSSVVTGLRGARDDLRHDRRDEQRHAVGALMQRAHERFVGGERWRAFRHVVGDLALGERIEHDLLAQAMQAQLVPQRVERMVQRDHLGETKGRQPHQAARCRAAARCSR